MPQLTSAEGRPIHHECSGPVPPGATVLVLHHGHIRTAAGVPIDGESHASLLSRCIDDLVARPVCVAGNP
jgi:hypothetical protein